MLFSSVYAVRGRPDTSKEAVLSLAVLQQPSQVSAGRPHIREVDMKGELSAGACEAVGSTSAGRQWRNQILQAFLLSQLH